MSDNSSIEWTDATWNPIRGCARVSEGCRNCYAERVAGRFSGPGLPYEGLTKVSRSLPIERRWNGTVRMVIEHLADPLRWRRPRRVFVNSMSDLFHESLTNEQIAAVFGVMAAAPQHTFQVLTKRARRMREWFEWARRDFTDQQRGIACAPNTFRAMLDAAFEVLGQPSKPVLDAAWHAHDDDAWPLPNVLVGVSVENQAAADERIPELLATAAAVRWISAEPLLGDVDLNLPRCQACLDRGYGSGRNHAALADDGATPWCSEHDEEMSCGHWLGDADCMINWIVAGCESGPGARSCDVAWLRSLRDQCAAAGVAYFLKQAVATPGVGVVAPASAPPEIIKATSPTDRTRFTDALIAGPGSHRKAGGVIGLPYLDGLQHAAMPEVTRG